jgi:hypothetical protein
VSEPDLSIRFFEKSWLDIVSRTQPSNEQETSRECRIPGGRWPGRLGGFYFISSFRSEPTSRASTHKRRTGGFPSAFIRPAWFPDCRTGRVFGFLFQQDGLSSRGIEVRPAQRV